MSYFTDRLQQVRRQSAGLPVEPLNAYYGDEERRPCSRLTLEQVGKIRELHAAGKKPKQIWYELSLNCSYPAVQSVCARRTWANV